MKRIMLGLACAVMLSAIPAFAQVGIYGKLDLNRYTDTNAGTKNWLYVGGIGVYDDFFYAGPASLGGDLRGDFASGNDHTFRSLIVRARLAAKLPVSRCGRT